MKISKYFSVILITLLVFSGGCAKSKSSRIYTESEALQAASVEAATVISVEDAILRKDGMIVGTASGAILGGIGGRGVGGGTGQNLAMAAGVLIGGILGHYAEQGLSDRKASKIIVKLDTGDSFAIVQEADVVFTPGERVYVITNRSDGIKRVSKMNN
ncbi:hypothetical protein [Psychromonas sp.]|uniref:outer membrane lipoprotein n=1 Tax=Psychromonas sp. TaxID=1884585 RepID=UPI0035619136